MNSYSQFGEDKFLNSRAAMPEKGYFCEVGAYNGVASSNTLAFEEIGWEGICIEPDHNLAEDCARNRRAYTFPFAVGDGPDSQVLHINPLDRGTSGLRRQPTGELQVVRVKPLRWFLDIWNPPRLDILSLDTEGSELEVWRTRGQWEPRFVICEFWTQPHPPDLQAILDEIIPCGYKLIHQTTANAIFEHVQTS